MRSTSPRWVRHPLILTVALLFVAACGDGVESDAPDMSGMDMAAETTDAHAGHAMPAKEPMAAESADPHAGHTMPQEQPNASPSNASADVVQIEPSVIQTIGVRTEKVTIAPLSRVIQSTARFEMDETGAHTVTLRTSGWVEKLYVTYEGALVTKGDPLLDLYSPDLVSTQEEYLLALRNVEKMAESPIAGLAEDSRRLLDAARRRLLFWDISEDQIEQLERTREPQRTLRFTAPASGEVMSKSVIEGQYVNAGEPLLKIYDTSRIWLIADIYEQDLTWIREGSPVTIELPYDPGKSFEGHVDHIYYMLDPATRTARARIIMPGSRRLLKPGMYATVRLQGQPLPPSPVVPEEAVIRTGDQDVVILSLGEGRFMPRAVRLGVLAEGRYRVLDGLVGDEVVVTRAQFLIDSESRLKSAVGAMAGHQH